VLTPVHTATVIRNKCEFPYVQVEPTKEATYHS
jgi:hypothetical protein